MTPLRKRMLDELQLGNYADFTIERYLDAVRSFVKFLGKPPDQASPEQIREYLLRLVKDRKASPSTVQVHRAALKFLFVRTLNQPWFDERVARTRKRPKIPTVLSAEEITRILDHTANLKHWTIIATFLCHWSAMQRAAHPQGWRYRQGAHGNSHPRGQRSHPTGYWTFARSAGTFASLLALAQAQGLALSFRNAPRPAHGAQDHPHGL